MDIEKQEQAQTAAPQSQQIQRNEVGAKRRIRTILILIILEGRQPRSMMYTMGMLMCNTVSGAF